MLFVISSVFKALNTKENKKNRSLKWQSIKNRLFFYWWNRHFPFPMDSLRIKRYLLSKNRFWLFLNELFFDEWCICEWAGFRPDLKLYCEASGGFKKEVILPKPLAFCAPIGDEFDKEFRFSNLPEPFNSFRVRLLCLFTVQYFRTHLLFVPNVTKSVKFKVAWIGGSMNILISTHWIQFNLHLRCTCRLSIDVPIDYCLSGN